jgi:hypothetical protein
MFTEICGTTTSTVIELLAVTDPFTQVSVYVPDVVIPEITWELFVDLDPLHAPLAEQLVALVLVHERVTDEPEEIEAGPLPPLTKKEVMAGVGWAEVTLTSTVRDCVCAPAPKHVIVYEREEVRTPVD